MREKTCAEPRTRDGLHGRHPLRIRRERFRQPGQAVDAFLRLKLREPTLGLCAGLHGLERIELRGRLLFLGQCGEIGLIGRLLPAPCRFGRIGALFFERAGLLRRSLGFLKIEPHRLEPGLVGRLEHALRGRQPQKPHPEIFGALFGRLETRERHAGLSLRVGLGPSGVRRPGR